MTDNENEKLRDEIHSLIAEMARWRALEGNREQRLDLLFENQKQLVEVYKKLNIRLDAMTNAVELIGQEMARPQKR